MAASMIGSGLARNQVSWSVTLLVLSVAFVTPVAVPAFHKGSPARWVAPGTTPPGALRLPPTTLRGFGERLSLEVGTFANFQQISSDARYRDVLIDDFGAITIGDDLKWGKLAPRRDFYSFEAADALIGFAEQHRQAVRGHPLVWHTALPAWLTGGTLTRDQLRESLREHIHTVVGRYRGRVAIWDVVNEPFDHATGQLRQSFWLEMLGPGYIADAFRWAHEADPGAKLYLNEYNIEEINPKSNGVYNMVRSLRQQGVPIHGVGFQAHLRTDTILRTLRENLDRFGSLGLDTAITELDVRTPVPVSAHAPEVQARVYVSAFQDCLKAARCVSYTVAGFTDAYSWIPTAYPGWGAACLYDEAFNRKPSWYQLRDAMANGP